MSVQIFAYFVDIVICYIFSLKKYSYYVLILINNLKSNRKYKFYKCKNLLTKSVFQDFVFEKILNSNIFILLIHSLNYFILSDNSFVNEKKFFWLRERVYKGEEGVPFPLFQPPKMPNSASFLVLILG